MFDLQLLLILRIVINLFMLEASVVGSCTETVYDNLMCVRIECETN